ncbi:MAG: thiol reductase thioredoxin, partial [Planctomycetaceae bacterium]
DARADVREALAMNGGHRVPMVLFLSEDGYEVARYGERTLSTYRRLASDQLGPACPTGIVPPGDDAVTRVVAEWLAEFERVQLILRLSSRLRQKHGD